ncbi:MAG: amino acid permease [Gammaproteobacteria bacterium]|nr:amino acid permease [Gammaproteobacteria bacterium]
MTNISLARKISLPLLTFYGVGTILGAGIYLLIGEVSLRAGAHAPIAFIVSSCIAAITAYSFARLSSMYPKSAGEVAYTQAAFNSQIISILVGLSVVLIGTVSASTMVKGFAGYFTALSPTPEILIISTLVVFITVFSIWGISQSMYLAAIITVIEILGLVFVIYAIADMDSIDQISLPTSKSIFENSHMIIYAGFISFYAYIGFEDIVNMAEETKNPTRLVPLAILLSLIISTLLYVILSIFCTSFIPLSVFEHSKAPLVSIIEYKGYNTTIMGLISIIAIINGALVQQLMASRVLYGMAKQNLFFQAFQEVNIKTRTPITATITIASIIFFLSISFDLITLAELTSMLTLIVFIIIQIALILLSKMNQSSRKLDFVLPPIGITLNIALIYFGYINPYMNDG